jgi:hypothetical protein
MKKLLVLLGLAVAVGVSAQTKISDLTSATSVADADVFPIVQSGTTKKVAYSVFKVDTTYLSSRADSIAFVYDSLELHLDTLQAHNTRINVIYDTLTLHLDTLQSHNTRLKAVESGAVAFDSTFLSARADSIAPLYDSIALHLDTLQAHNTRLTSVEGSVDSIAPLYDSIANHLDTLQDHNTRLKAVEGDVSEASTVLWLLQDTMSVFVFGAGGGAAGDTALFFDGADMGGFYHMKDTLIITDLVTSISTGDTMDIVIVYNDTAWVAGDTLYAAAVDTLTDIVTTFTETKIPPGNEVWMDVTAITVTRKPIKFRATLLGYIKRD